MIWTYVIIAVLLLAAELVYFCIADKCTLINPMNGARTRALCYVVEA